MSYHSLKILGDFYSLHVKINVLNFADGFQNFRQVCKRNYNLDKAHMFTSLEFAFQASLKMNKQALEFLLLSYATWKVKTHIAIL